MMPLSLSVVLAFGAALLPHAGEPQPAAAPQPAGEAAPAVDEIVVDVREEAGVLVIAIGGERYSLEEFEQLMRRRVDVNPDLSVRIRGEASMPWQRMADVISTCSQAGVWNISFSRQMPGGADAARKSAPTTSPSSL